MGEMRKRKRERQGWERRIERETIAGERERKVVRETGVGERCREEREREIRGGRKRE